MQTTDFYTVQWSIEVFDANINYHKLLNLKKVHIYYFNLRTFEFWFLRTWAGTFLIVSGVFDIVINIMKTGSIEN